MGKVKRKPTKKINTKMRRKLAGLFGAVLLALVGLTLRITFINATSGEKYKKQVLSQAQQQYDSRVLPGKRGDIYDRNGNLLATSNKVYNIILDCYTVNSDEGVYVEATVNALVNQLGFDEAQIRAKLTSPSTMDSQYQIIRKEVSMDVKKEWESYLEIPEDSNMTAEEIKARSNVKGIWFEETYLRSYPFRSLACDTVGFCYDRNSADWGLEGYYNSTLVGADGRRYGYLNQSSDVEQTIIEPMTGNSIVTSIDVGAQQIVEKYVNAFNEAMGAEHVGVIVEDPSTGEILAMDGGDRYDLNDPRDLSSVYTEEEIEAMNDVETVEALNGMWNNYCITDAFEPGSVVKPIVVAAALEKGAISENSTFYCDGYQQFGSGDSDTIRCWVYPGAHGEETLMDIIANSCNDGMMQIGAIMGKEQFIKTQSQFNFGTRTGVDLPNEGAGIIHTLDSMGVTELACSTFGQGFTCTMIQEINAICSVINGGYYYQPHLVTRVMDSSGGVVKSVTPTLLKQTISSNISAASRTYMEACVLQGTGTSSKVQGYSMGGKTGTAEKLPRGNGKYLVSFVGFAPVDDPKVVIYVVLDEMDTESQDNSAIPQYVAQGILSELLPYMNITPDEADGYTPSTSLWTGFSGHLKDVNLTILTDEEGNYVDEDGNRIDSEGNRVDEQGYLLDENGNYRFDDNGQLVMTEAETRGESGYSTEAIDGTNLPEPPEDTSEPLFGNDQQSEGITNEEAGLE